MEILSFTQNLYQKKKKDYNILPPKIFKNFNHTPHISKIKRTQCEGKFLRLQSQRTNRPFTYKELPEIKKKDQANTTIFV